ncbi:MAG: MgtC/SapB family protein [Thermoguttaceae bacterium]
MHEIELFQNLGISLVLGLLVGLQRERSADNRPGVRTFPLITLLGTVSAILADRYGGWMLLGSMMGVVSVLAFQRIIHLRQKDPDPGVTTEFAVLVMFCVGALLRVAPMEVPIAIGGGVAILLQFKPEMHRIANTLGNDDLKAIMQFVLITCIILPILPNENYGPYEVFNPWKTWLLVVLIVGMSLGGYIVYKFFGRDAGIMLGGILGGAISSTATTVSYSRQARGRPDLMQVAAIVVMVASAVVFVRVLVEIAVVSPRFLSASIVPIALLMLLTAAPAVVMWYRVRKLPSEMPKQANPTQLKSALIFAAMYALVLLALAATKAHLGTRALYVVSAISGLTDMDAITLSTASMANRDPQMLANGWRMILVAALSNLVFKACLVGILGGKGLFLQVAFLFAVPMVGGILLLLFLPSVQLWPT